MEDHKCKYVTATCYDSHEALHRKYPQARRILERFLSHDGTRGLADRQCLQPLEEQAVIPEESTGQDEDTDGSASEWEGLSPSFRSRDIINPITDAVSTFANGPSIYSLSHSAKSNISFHASVSASNLPRYKPIRRKAPYNKIVFNFPHVGGLSTDVNRQVRANQELLVAFFRSCRPLQASAGEQDKPGALESTTGSGKF